MKERDLQVLFKKHIEKHPPTKTEVYEFKICKTTSFPFNKVADHQIEALKKAEIGGLYHKLTDQPWIQDRKHPFTLKKPFDAFFAKCEAYIVVWFYKPRQKKIFYKIRIHTFLALENKIGRKSIKEAELKKYAEESLEI